ncbi:3-hydroxyacyl-CoA dehydrogenase family protein [Pedobacter heparinus]|uniref:3-hydroxyacyl-CoA dehydrogenase family protein n=1 Tax=Pedobacter heparinus TaxID=984 RepID=UPI002930D1AB|nr:3-hydroxyacyl-CoA dehydrogenase family protein [Pedobacter heparinus]
MDSIKLNPADIPVGVVGIGLMGSSIIVALLSSGHIVKAIAPIFADLEGAKDRITQQLKACLQASLMKETVDACLDRLDISEDYNNLKTCSLVLECVIEDSKIKAQVYRRITDVVPANTVIASNTSAITITELQKLVTGPERFIGVHWAEPAYATRFMEITCGEETDKVYAEWAFNLAHHWRKEPTLLKKDTRGFITNRLMYAVYREIFSLIESGKTNMDDADKVFRYDVGSWITLMGLFRRIDYTGLKDQAVIFKNLFPQLSNSDKVPTVMQNIVEINGRGIQNLKGLYSYTDQEAKDWERAFFAFNEEILRLAARYPDPILDIEKALV